MSFLRKLLFLGVFIGSFCAQGTVALANPQLSTCVNECLDTYHTSCPPPSLSYSPPLPGLVSPPPFMRSPMPSPPRMLSPPPSPQPPSPTEEETDDEPPYSPDEPVEAGSSSPPPPPPSTPGLEQDNYKMTEWFPLGSCKMNGPSVPYRLGFDSWSIGQGDKIGKLCFKINLQADYQNICAARQLTSACDAMVRRVTKIVLWYKMAPECGFDLTKSKKIMNLFNWMVKSGRKNVLAGRYAFFAANATQAHATGDLKLFKWGYKDGKKLRTSVEVEINRPVTFRRAIDDSLDGYRLCLNYNPDILPLYSCITKRDVLKYSFYDPKKTICTSGSASMLSAYGL